MKPDLSPPIWELEQVVSLYDGVATARSGEPFQMRQVAFFHFGLNFWASSHSNLLTHTREQ